MNIEKKVKQVKCGGGHTGVIAADGEDVYFFGRGRDGQLGRGDGIESIAAYRTDPKPVTALSAKAGIEVTELSLGNNHSLALAIKKI